MMILHPAPDHCSKITREKELTEEQKFSSLLQKNIFTDISITSSKYTKENVILILYSNKCD